MCELSLNSEKLLGKTNLHLIMTQNISNILKQSNCWICTHVAEHTVKGVPLTGIPMLAGSSTINLWDYGLAPDLKQEREIILPSPV